MGKAADTIKRKKKKKKKCRSDLQKQTHHPNADSQFIQTTPNHKTPLQNPNLLNTTPPLRRSSRRNPNPGFPSPPEDDSLDASDDDDERTEKKVKLVRRLPSDDQLPKSSPIPPSFNSLTHNSHWPAQGDGFHTLSNTRKVNAVASGYACLQEDEKVSKATDNPNGTGIALQDGPTTHLPDKKLLLVILDKLQKKDTRGVFAEPVDPEELPDYHEVIENPMDFDTVRKKLDQGVYLSLEQFEADIYLICSNAMQYNAPHTIYFRQARSIQELAKKEFEIFRQAGGHADTQPKVVRRGRPPKKPVESAPVDHMGLKSSSDATLATTGADDSGRSNTYNLRKGPSLHRYRPPDGFKKASSGPRSSDNCYEFQAPKTISSKPGKKQFLLDESKCDTYHNPFLLASGHDLSGLFIEEGQMRQLTPVGLHVNHSYARSLARFAADLGPVAWKIASRKMAAVLPPGVEFGSKWVEETGSLPLQQPVLFEKLVSLENSSNSPHLSTLGSSCTSAIDKSFIYGSDEEPVVARGSSFESGFHSLKGIAMQGLGLGPKARPGAVPSHQINQPMFLSRMNGSGGQYGFHFAPHDQGMLGTIASVGNTSLVGSPLTSQLNRMFSGGNIKANLFEDSHIGSAGSLSRKNSSQTETLAGVNGNYEAGIHGKPSWQEVYMHGGWNPSSDIPPDPNVGFQASSLPNSGVHIGSPPQLDLMLQL